MTTTYILHGGKSKVESKGNDLFFHQPDVYVKKDEIKILMCYWARAKNQWEELFKRDTPKFVAQTKKKVTFSIAENPEDAYTKLTEHDVFFVSGGEGYHIEPLYPKLDKLKQTLEGKVYMGSSMGAFLVSRNYVLSLSTQDEHEVHEGLGIVPINTLCHWNIEKHKEEKVALLKKKDPETPIVPLDEEQFSVFVF